MTCDHHLGDVLRLMCWIKLIRIWAALRTGDMSGIPALNIRMKGGGIRGEIHCSKTSGTGKKIQIMNFYVSKNAWVDQEEWISQGRELYVRMRSRTSFMVGLPNKDLTEMTASEPSYMQHCMATRKLLLDTPVLEHHEPDEEDWRTQRCSKAKIITPGAQTYWSGHSERATLTTWASAM